VADAAVYVLEGAPVPLSGHDIVRQIRLQTGREVERPTLNVALSSDRRACWGGQGVYGLYRHGLIPGPRTLASVAQVLLLAAEEEFHISELAFVMDHMGYVFTRGSLQSALYREAKFDWPAPATVYLDPDAWHLDPLFLAPSAVMFDDILRDLRSQVRIASQEYLKRSPRQG
jgi:hypothetical protein